MSKKYSTTRSLLHQDSSLNVASSDGEVLQGLEVCNSAFPLKKTQGAKVVVPSSDDASPLAKQTTQSGKKMKKRFTSMGLVRINNNLGLSRRMSMQFQLSRGAASVSKNHLNNTTNF